MSIFDAEYNTNKGFNANELNHGINNKDRCSFEYMFNTNSFYSPFGQDYERSVGSPLLDHQQRASPFLMNDNIFAQQIQPWGREWSDGSNPSPNSYGSNPSSVGNSFGSNPSSIANSFGSIPSSNPLMAEHSTPPPQQQSRIMNFISKSPPAANTISSNSDIESMKISDFLNHQPSNNFQPPSNNFQQPSNNFQQPSNDFQPPSNDFTPSFPVEEPLSNPPLQQNQGDSDSFFTDILSPFNSLFLNDDKRKKSNESSESEDKPVNVWDSLNNISVDLSTAAPQNVKNAWAKPLKFKSNNSESKPEPKPKVNEPVRAAPQKTLPPASVASIGRKVSELDDFDCTVPSRPAQVVRPGGFQVVCNKKKQNNKTANKAPKQRSTSPPAGVEKCSYGVRCLFGVECSRWHSHEDHEAFKKQQLPNGARKCPWGAKCFRKLKCINYHCDKDIELFQRDQ